MFSARCSPRDLSRGGCDVPPPSWISTVSHRFICTAPVDREGHRTNYVHLLKILIFCYLSTQEVGENLSRHPFRGAGSHNPPNPQLPALLSPSLPVLDYSLSSMFLEQADFRAIQMKLCWTSWKRQSDDGNSNGQTGGVKRSGQGKLTGMPLDIWPWRLRGASQSLVSRVSGRSARIK